MKVVLLAPESENYARISDSRGVDSEYGFNGDTLDGSDAIFSFIICNDNDRCADNKGNVNNGNTCTAGDD